MVAKSVANFNICDRFCDQISLFDYFIDLKESVANFNFANIHNFCTFQNQSQILGFMTDFVIEYLFLTILLTPRNQLQNQLQILKFVTDFANIHNYYTFQNRSELSRFVNDFTTEYLSLTISLALKNLLQNWSQISRFVTDFFH